MLRTKEYPSDCFQNVMMKIFQIEGVFIYIDDIIIIGSTLQEFFDRIQRVLQCARSGRVNIGLRKCKFVTDKQPIDILGSTFQFKQRKISKKRADALIDILAPKTIKEVRSLVGSVNFIRVDGASSAALSSDVFFNSSDSNYIFNLDFKNAFNSVSRSSILPLLRKHFPEVEPFFFSFYGKSSTLVYENFDLLSSSGVKQGDPLGPFFFCLAIHPLMCELKEKFPEIDIVAYMDDISVFAPITILKQIATFIQQRYEDIGLSLNISKCLIIGHEPIDFFH
ncbi:hypothetical protein P9112_009750 [Eukaryota sp. TZLM1-RC]